MVRIEHNLLPSSQKLNNKLTLQKGQVFNGKVIKLLKNQHALVSFLGSTYTAKLSTPLQAGNHYWFNVKDTNPTLTLQIFKLNKTNNNIDNLSNILEQIDLPQTDIAKTILLYFINQKLPISKEGISKAINLFHHPPTENELGVLHFMVDHHYPLNQSVFHALLTYREMPSFASALSLLEKQLLPFRKKNKPVSKLLSLLEGWSYVEKGEDSRFSHTLTPQIITDLLKKMGMNFERTLDIDIQTQESEVDYQNLKALLLAVKDDETLPMDLKHITSDAIDYITGQQLHNINQTQAAIQLVYTLPLRLGEGYTDMKVVWEGKKGDNDKLDSDNCRILFYVTLSHLKETAIQLNIFKRRISVQIYNEARLPIEPLINHFLPILKEKLAELNYTVSSITQVQKCPTYNQNHGLKSYGMMDVKI